MICSSYFCKAPKPGNTAEIGGQNHTIGQIAGGDSHNHTYQSPPHPAKDEFWRNSKIKAIKARCADQLGDQDAYKAYIRKNFNAGSLTDPATDELQRTYAYVMAKKAATRVEGAGNPST